MKTLAERIENLNQQLETAKQSLSASQGAAAVIAQQMAKEFNVTPQDAPEKLREMDAAITADETELERLVTEVEQNLEAVERETA